MNNSTKCRAYLPYWWEYLKVQYVYGNPESGLQGGTIDSPFPANHEIWEAFSFQNSSKVSRPQRGYLQYLGKTDDRIRAAVREQCSQYMDIWSQWYLRDISSDNLCPEDLSKLFIAPDGVRSVFITEEELEEDEAREAILAEQRDLFEKHLGWRPCD